MWQQTGSYVLYHFDSTSALTYVEYPITELKTCALELLTLILHSKIGESHHCIMPGFLPLFEKDTKFSETTVAHIHS